MSAIIPFVAGRNADGTFNEKLEIPAKYFFTPPEADDINLTFQSAQVFIQFYNYLDQLVQPTDGTVRVGASISRKNGSKKIPAGGSLNAGDYLRMIFIESVDSPVSGPTVVHWGSQILIGGSDSTLAAYTPPSFKGAAMCFSLEINGMTFGDAVNLVKYAKAFVVRV